MTSRSPLSSLARSPLHGVTLPDGLREIPFVTQVDLRADPTDAELLDRLAVAIGVALPLEPDTVVVTPDGRLRVAWLAPDEWLVIGPDGGEAEGRAGLETPGASTIEAGLRAALDGSWGVVVDVSANRTMLALTGPHALDALASGCSIDLDPRVFGPGRCAQTTLARANVILMPVTAGPELDIRILVRPSFARYLATWIEDALEA